ncbi:MAG: hypothetical protein HY347_10065 [candidate division NC10 bacterium]|nr:hypothetical protein [candidate division NC10 bacterium]
MENFLETTLIFPLEELWRTALDFLPLVGSAVLIIGMGWLLALILRRLSTLLLHLLGLDLLVEKIGLRRVLEGGGITRQTSALAGDGIYWLTLLIIVQHGVTRLGFFTAAEYLNEVLFFILRLILATVLLTFGLAIGRFLEKVVRTSMQLVNPSLAVPAGKVAFVGVLFLAAMMALAEIGIPVDVLWQSLMVLMVTIPVAGIVVLGFASRQTLEGLIAGRLLRRHLRTGQEIEVDGFKGKVVAFHWTVLEVDLGGRTGFFPYAHLMGRSIFTKDREG